MHDAWFEQKKAHHKWKELKSSHDLWIDTAYENT